MEIIHFSAECVPAAKVGGLADVVGALPKYLTRLGQDIKVVIPFYQTPFFQDTEFEEIFAGVVALADADFAYSVQRCDVLGFELLALRIPKLFDRPEIYGYPDDTERFTAFQIAALDWILAQGIAPDVFHCHDHHTGLIPFLLQEGTKYQQLSRIPVVATIHNAQYQGDFGFERLGYLPQMQSASIRFLEWHGRINPLAAAIKCAWTLTTVSPGYLGEMQQNANGLEALLLAERAKSVGILNGIDTEVWNPASDPYLDHHYGPAEVESGKQKNKISLCEQFGLHPKQPLFCFIGRFVYEKGADLLPEVVHRLLAAREKVSIFILGSGDPAMQEALPGLQRFSDGNFNCYIGYNEKLAHRVYAAADFLLMPSRVEPCGLNQMYALRYGCLPVVCNTGGLSDTVNDIAQGGTGIVHQNSEVSEILEAISRAQVLYRDGKTTAQIRKKAMATDHSWERSAGQYIEIYESLKGKS